MSKNMCKLNNNNPTNKRHIYIILLIFITRDYCFNIIN